MNILYYIEPYYEFNNPKFRIPTIKSIIVKHIEKIHEADQNNNFAIVLSNKTLELCKNIIPEYIKTYGIKISKYELLYRSSIEYACSVYNDNDEKKLKELSKSVKKEINFTPDIVILYESASEKLCKLLFPKSKILHMMFGPFSRPPFPSTTYYSTQGIYNNSEICNIKNREMEDHEKDKLNIIRRRTMKCIAELNPIKKMVSHLRSKYRNIILICCQIDNYFAFNVCTSYKNQYEMILNVIQNIPEDIGIVVTSHGEFKRQLNDDQINYLHTFSNLEIIDTIIPYISQFLMPYIDGVITVSSSLGFQAALWNKPLIVPGKSHLTPLSIGSKIQDIIPYIYGKKSINNDSILFDILYKFTFFDDFDLKDGNNILSIYKKCIDGENILNKRNEFDLAQIFIKYFRGLILKNILNQKQIEITPDYFRMAISEAKAISFDVFDTLIVRPVSEPWHLFLAVEQKARELLCDSSFNFVYFRRLAESDMRRISGSSLEITIEEIYIRFKELTGISDDLANIIMQYEINCEIDYCKESRILKKEYNFAKLLCKNISIISDIYLHTETIKVILANAGYSDYNLLLVSADKKVRKEDGQLFRIYLNHIIEKLNIKPNDCLHIGDNLNADMKQPRKYGMKSYCLPKSIQNYSKSYISKYLESSIQKNNLSGSFVAGSIANRWYNDTYNKIISNSAFEADPFILGYCALGPLVLGFIQWLHLKTNIQNNNHLYFLARDGWILRKAYNLLYKDNAIDNSYLYCSRRSTSIPAISNINDIFEIAFRNFDARPLKDLLYTRFGILIEDIPSEILKECSISLNDIVTPLRNQAKLRHFFERISDIIMLHAQEEKTLFLDYCNKQNLYRNIKNGRPGFVDIGYSGSMQKYISKIYKTDSIDGYYLLTHFHSRYDHVKSHFDGFLASYDDHKIIDRHQLNNNVFIIESVLSSPEGSFVRFHKKNNNIISEYIYSNNEEKRIKLLKSIHNGCIEFIKDTANYGSEYRNSFDLPNRIAEKIIFKYANNPTHIDSSIFVDSEVENLYGGGSVNLIEKSKNTKQGHEEIAGIIERSKWKKGSKAFYKIIDNDNSINIKSNSDISKSVKYFTREELLHRKLDRDPISFFRDSKFIWNKILGYIYKRIPQNSFMAQAIIKISHKTIIK